MRVAYWGNYGPLHSTENHIARALEFNGHQVLRLQENDVELWRERARGDLDDVDFYMWTMTGWPWDAYGLSREQAHALQVQFLYRAARKRIPVVGMHLDIWWGLKREHLVTEEPFFLSDIVITADGGHDELWAEAEVNHVWMPPGISLAEAEIGTLRDDFRSPMAFVGSHDGSYHQEHEHRHQLVAWLRQNFRRDCAFWPRPGEHAIRGKDLQDLYASTDVVIGDSCFAGTGLTRYVSDRVPETLGRGGFLIHPEIAGVTDGQGWWGGPTWCGGEHLLDWQAGNWDSLGSKIQWSLDNPDMRRAISAAGREHVRQHHTYERRVEQVVDLLRERSLIEA